MAKERAETVEIFYSYAYTDESLRDELAKHLSLMRWQGLITEWYSRNISAGKEWEHEVDAHLNTAHIILLLVSPDFMASTYCYSKEMKRAMERHQSGEACVIPVILRPTDWKEAPFGKLQALPQDGMPVMLHPNLDKALLNAAQGIRERVEDLISSSSRIIRSELVAEIENLDAFIFQAAWSPNGGYLASVGSDGIIHIWDGQTFMPMKSLIPKDKQVDWLRCLVWSPNAQLLIAAGDDRQSQVWNVETATVQKILLYPMSPILGLNWSSLGIGVVAENGWIALLSTPTDTWYQLPTITSSIQKAQWAKHEPMLAIVYVDGKLLVQRESVVIKETELESDGQQIRTLSWDTAETYLAVAGKDGKLTIWETPQLTKLAEWNARQKDIKALCWIQEEYQHYLISGDNRGVIKIWRVPEGKEIRMFDTHRGPITTLATSPDMTFLCSAHEKGKLVIWNIRELLNQGDVEGHN